MAQADFLANQGYYFLKTRLFTHLIRSTENVTYVVPENTEKSFFFTRNVIFLKMEERRETKGLLLSGLRVYISK